jgi:hypothetical protein
MGTPTSQSTQAEGGGGKNNRCNKHHLWTFASAGPSSGPAKTMKHRQLQTQSCVTGLLLNLCSLRRGLGPEKKQLLREPCTIHAWYTEFHGTGCLNTLSASSRLARCQAEEKPGLASRTGAGTALGGLFVALVGYIQGHYL